LITEHSAALSEWSTQDWSWKRTRSPRGSVISTSPTGRRCTSASAAAFAPAVAQDPVV